MHKETRDKKSNSILQTVHTSCRFRSLEGIPPRVETCVYVSLFVEQDSVQERHSCVYGSYACSLDEQKTAIGVSFLEIIQSIQTPDHVAAETMVEIPSALPALLICVPLVCIACGIRHKRLPFQPGERGQCMHAKRERHVSQPSPNFSAPLN